MDRLCVMADQLQSPSTQLLTVITMTVITSFERAAWPSLQVSTVITSLQVSTVPFSGHEMKK